MIFPQSVLVDSSVWINHFRGNITASVAQLHTFLAEETAEILTADLIVLEIVRGCRTNREALRVEEVLAQFDCISLGGLRASLAAAHRYRALRAKGVTVSKTVDLLIANWCIDEQVALLHDDRDFADFVPLGLACV